MYNEIFRKNRITIFFFLVQAILFFPVFNNFSVYRKMDGKIYLLFLVLVFTYYDKCELH